jgi:glutamine synthetase
MHVRVPQQLTRTNLLEIAATLESAGIEVEQIHHEASQGQFELVLRYTEVVRTIENYLIARLVIQK